MRKIKKRLNIKTILLICNIILFFNLVIIFSIYNTSILNEIGYKYENQNYNEYIFIDGKASKIIADYTYKKIKKIPHKIIDSFILDGGIVHITNRNLKELLGNNDNNEKKLHLVGIFNSKDIEIWLTTKLYAIYDGRAAHEFGHYLDFKKENISLRNEFESIYISEKEKFKKIENSNYYQTQKELFAEGFGKYCNEPTLLKKYCPLMYEFFDNLINDFTLQFTPN